ncbi:hypothetical protein PF005_g10130 [Phytophthora fragariae]|uniref:Uncharacterized protein n=1 Tax=Phytophthora fragariae TaxID=53985 RepID=A0A6A3Y7K1_9STRA|nr:hypothetical protein PF003_g3861 [Phytophthora fragariae]KAE9213613.1 hypothetical protein PF005_g10130 [Phytophthora fragariae]
MRGPASHTPIMSDHLRRQFPRDGDIRKPSLRFLAGGM